MDVSCGASLRSRWHKLLLQLAIVACSTVTTPNDLMLTMIALNEPNTRLIFTEVSQTERMASLNVKSANLVALRHGDGIFVSRVFFRNSLKLTINAF